MQVLMDAGVVLLAYILGAIPFGLLIVKVTTGKDIRLVASGRTGGTNAMRAAGCWAGAATALFDHIQRNRSSLAGTDIDTQYLDRSIGSGRGCAWT